MNKCAGSAISNCLIVSDMVYKYKICKGRRWDETTDELG